MKDVELANQWKSGLPRVAVFTAVAFVAAWLLTRHSNHVWQFLPYALLLACPLMHLMHHRHRH
jgi:hypothetical protein